MKKSVIFLCPCDITHPNRGTPIRVAALYKELGRDDRFTVTLYQTNIQPFFQRIRDIAALNGTIIFANTHRDILTALAAKIVLGKKIVVDLHGAVEEEQLFYQQISSFRRSILRGLYRIAFRLFDLLSCVCEPMRTEYVPRTAQKRTFVIRAGIESLPELPPSIKQEKPLRLGYIGNARGYQGFDTVLRVCQRLAEEKQKFTLHIVSSERESMEKAIRDLFPTNPAWLECSFELPHAEAQAAMQTCDVLLLLRPRNLVTTFSFPAKLPEYLATGKTTIVSTVSDIQDVLTHGTHAYLVSPERAEEEALDLIQQLLDGRLSLLNPNVVRAHVQEQFTWKHLCTPLFDAISTL